MPWYAFHRGGWQIAVNAINERDARKHVSHNATGAEFDGEMHTLPTLHNPSMATAMVTSRMRETFDEDYKKYMDSIRRMMKQE